VFPENKKALLFDLDGTLVDSAPDLALAINQMLTELHLSTFPQDTIRSWVGNGAQTLVERALSGSVTIDSTLDPVRVNQALPIFLSAYRQCLCEESTLYPEVKETLVALKGLGYRLAVVTNKPAQFIEPIIDGLGLNGLFELFIGGDSLTERKPHPLPIYHACQQLAVNIELCLMIGDSKNDILAAKAAKMESVGFTYGYNYGEDIAIYHPEWRLEHFSALLPLLAKN